MTEPDILQQQRYLVQAFRKGGSQRASAEATNDTEFKTERQAADQAHASALAEAQATRAKSEAHAQARLKTEKASADAELSQVRQTSDRHMGEVRNAEQQARAALEEARWLLLVEDIGAAKPAIDTSRHASQELVSAAHDATQATKLIPGLVKALDEARERRQHRQQVVGGVILVSALAMIAGGLTFFANWQREQATERYWATVTAEAIEVPLTATAELVAAQATTTAEVIRAQPTATAMAPVLAQMEERTGMEMIYVPPGHFIMGNPSPQGYDEYPQRTVFLSAYWIDETEVTAAQYRECVELGDCSAAGTSNLCTHPDQAKSDHPINCVTWKQAAEYCQWAGKRLPTEAEWEKAARGMDGRIYPWGNQAPSQTLANLGRNEGATTPVSQYPAGASPYGILDMAGNLWEWVEDRYIGDYYSQSSNLNPQPPSTGESRVVRGGSWNDVGAEVRAANRQPENPGQRSATIGFRCVYSP